MAPLVASPADDSTTEPNVDESAGQKNLHLEIFHCLVQPIWIYDFVEERNRWANHAGLEFWEAPSLDEYLSRDRRQDRSSSTYAKLKATQAKIESGGHIQVHWTLYPKGIAKSVNVTVSGIQLEDEDHFCMLFHAVPIDRETLESKSLRSLDMLRHLPMAVCQFDLEGKAMYENQWAEQQMERSDSKENKTNPGRGSESDKPENDFVRRFVDRNVAKEALQTIKNQSNINPDTVKLEAELRGRGGNTEWCQVSLQRTTDPVTGKSVILYNAQDKTDFHAAEKERVASTKKSEFLAIMAHEIRTPLHQVIGFLDLLEQSNPLSEEQDGYIKVLQASAQGLMTVISDVLDISKLEAGEMKIESILYEPRSVMEGSIAAVKQTCEDKGLSLTIDWSKEIPFRVIGDPNRVRQILLNLLSNAIKFTTNGSIHVQAKITKSDVGCGKFVYISVEDTGVGLSAENQDRVFSKYHQAHSSTARTNGGTGLGLSICKSLVHAMGGKIGVESDLGEGSTFWFALPLRNASKEAMDRHCHTCTVDTTCDSHSIHPLNILVAEDNVVNQKLISKMLKRLGHDSTIAANGQIALGMLAERHNHFDVVLMDVQMPVMDGLEATKRLRARGYTNLPIIALTASVKQCDFQDLGFDDWLPKPTKLNQLQVKLQKAVHKQKNGIDNGLKQ